MKRKRQIYAPLNKQERYVARNCNKTCEARLSEHVGSGTDTGVLINP
jgi:hypothetical protein